MTRILLLLPVALLLSGCEDGYAPRTLCREASIDRGTCMKWEYVCNLPLVLGPNGRREPRCFMPEQKKQ